MKIIAMVQARMGSRRLPGKVLKSIQGRPLLWYVISRLQKVPRIDEVVILTSTSPKDEEVVVFGKHEGVPVFRGSEEDVLKRYTSALQEYPCEAIVRITGDCPFIDPDVIGQLIEVFREQELDYVHTGQTYPEGLDTEVISARAIVEADRNATKNYQREHVTQYIHDHKDNFRCTTLELDENLGKYRLSVDEEEDLVAVSELIKHLGKRSTIASMKEVIQTLNAHPEIGAVNKHITRNEGLLRSKAEENR